MILVDETKLTNKCIAMIGEDYGMEYEMKNFSEESYKEYIEKIVERLQITPEELMEKLDIKKLV